MKVGRIEKLAISTLLTVMFFAAAVLTLPRARAEGTTDIVEITVPVSCSMTGTVSTAHTKSVLNAHVEEDIGTTAVEVVCNDNSGYAVYAIGYTDDEYGKTVLTDSTLGSTSDIATGLATMGDTSNWAMKLTKAGSSYFPIIMGSSDDGTRQTGDPDFSDYAVVPSEYTKVLYYPSSTDVGTGASGSNFTTTYRAYISRTQLAGTYVGQVKYTLVHPSTEAAPMTPLKDSDCPAGYVCYAPNASDIVGSMSSLGSIASSSIAGKIIVGTSGTFINLIAPNYKRAGYGFAGWSTDFTATNASTIYGPNETLTIPSTTLATNGMILYPVWVASTGNLQGWSNCSSLTTAPNDGTRATLASVTALTDTRDGNVYTVARLADGKCWMTENLRLNSENSVGAENIAKAQGYGDATNATQGNLGKFIGLANSEDANFYSDTANSLYSVDGSNGTININSKSSYFPAYRMPRYNKNNTNMATNATNSDNTTTLTDSHNANNNHVRWYGYGNYYTWPAAIADTAYYDQNNTSVTTTSICPTGWRLPQGGMAYAEGNTSGVNVTNDPSTYRDFYNLGYVLMGSVAYESQVNSGNSYYDNTPTNTAGDTATKAFRKFPNNFVYSGYFGGSGAGDRGSYGYYWSRSVNNSNNAYRLYLNSSNVYPGTYGFNKSTGFSVRCISQ